MIGNFRFSDIFKNKYYTAVFIITLFISLASLSYFATSYLIKPTPPKPGSYALPALANTSIRSTVKDVHDNLSNLLCYDRNPSDYSVFSELSLNIQTVLPYTNGELKDDLEVLINLLDKAAKKHDRDEAIKAHRVAHDLDWYYFTPPEKWHGEYWGVTKVLTGKNKYAK